MEFAEKSSATLAIGPANYAGQAYHWAEAVRRHLGQDAISFANRGTLGPWSRSSRPQFPVHATLPHHRATTTFGKARRIRRILSEVTHLAIDGFLPVYDRLDRSHVGEELERFKALGLKMALIAHGGDVRDPQGHLDRYPFSFFADAPSEWVDTLRAQSARNQETVESSGLPVFVSTPDLLFDIPRARWLPLCIDVDSWKSPRSAMDTDLPTVLHIPSRRNPPIKGTRIIEPVLEDLAAQGRIRYVSPYSATRAELRDLVTSADVVVDQILTGSYGVAAVEGMAAGRVVVGYVDGAVRALMPEDPPILDAPPDDFVAAMNRVLESRGDVALLAQRGEEFARRWHDGTASAAVLADFVS